MLVWAKHIQYLQSLQYSVRMMSLVTDENEGVRARKKRQTRRAIHRAALELLHEGDLATVTAEAIAARAGVSARTFFNYYPTKEAALSGTDPGLPEQLAAMMRARPASESTVEAVRAVLATRLRDLERDDELAAMRRDVARRYSTLAAAMVGSSAIADRAIAAAACERLGVAIGSSAALAPLVEAYAALGAVRAAVWQHMEAGFEGDLDARVTAALDHLARGV